MSKKITSREFNQDVSKAKRESLNGPVFITDRGTVSHVLLSISEYEQLTKQQPTILQQLAMSNAETIEFEAEQLDKLGIRPQEFD